MSKPTDVDIMYMRRALQLARLGQSFVSPNPMVGAVIVCDGKIIGEGYHRRFGSWHAEVNAVNSVSDKALLKRSTMYVTLEPCCHYGKTPPCSKLIVDMGIPRVVVGSLDPNEKVSGKGVGMLRDAGVDVLVGCLQQECMELNKRFMTAHSQRRPYVLLKWAQDAAGVMGVKDGEGVSCPIPISNQITSMFMHRERSLYDAILVGANTVVSDAPQLSVRKWVARQNPLRVILDPAASLTGVDIEKCGDAQTLLYVKKRKTGVVYPTYVDVVELGETAALIEAILANLYSRGISSVMVEGGAYTLSQFIVGKHYDEIRCERSLLEFPLADGVTGIYAPIPVGVLKNVESHFKNLILRYSSAELLKNAIE